jgi:hypothetical protein
MQDLEGELDSSGLVPSVFKCLDDSNGETTLARLQAENMKLI